MAAPMTDTSGMRIVFCGSGSLAVPVLDAVRSCGCELVAVVTQPPRPAGRGGKLTPTNVEQAAEAAGLHVRRCEDINAPDSVAFLREQRADVMVVVDFGQFIRLPARQAARRSAFNLHGSLLPELRGAAPIQWAIIRGYRRTGVTTFELVDEMDAGPIYLQRETPIDPAETAEELRARLGALGAEAVVETIRRIACGHAEPVEQDHTCATLAPRLKKRDGRIDFSADAVSIRNLVHGTWPWPGARAVFHRSGGKALQVTLARAGAEPGGAAPPGAVDKDLAIGTGEGRLRVRELQPAGKRLMQWRDFVNGYRVTPGDRFDSLK